MSPRRSIERGGQPGGVSIQRSFDELGRLISESGTGGGATSATRSFGYDLSGLRTSASHPQGTQSFSYDDRGLLTSSTGPAGNASYTHDASGRLTSRTDPAGAHSFTWTARGELSSASDPLTGITRTHTFDDASQLTEVSYGSGSSPKRDLSWDDLGRVTADTLKDASGATKASYSYAYDADSNLTTQAINLPGNPLSGTHTYSYDRARRISSWTKPDSSTVSYTWDKVGNRTAAGAATFSYDQRNRLSSSTEPAVSLLGSVTVTRSFSYTPRGTLKEVTDGATTQRYTFDALGRQTAYDDGVAPASFTYDALDRIAQRSQGLNTASFSYSGFDIDPAGDGTFTYARSPAGRLLSMKKGSDSFLAGMNRHGDLTYLFETDADLTDTRVYDPFGKLAEKTGLTDPNLGFQSDFTDPTSGKVWMGSRWYGPNEAQFLSRDTVFGQLQTPVSLNRYTYAFGDPLDYFDPDGRWPKWVDRGVSRVKRQWTRFKNSELAIAAYDAVYTQMGVSQQARSAIAEQRRTQRIQLQRKQHRLPPKSTLGNDLKRSSYGALVGLTKLVLGTAKLTTPMGQADAVESMKGAYKEGGLLEAVNQVNPVYSLLWSQENYRDALRTGNPEAAGEAGIQLTADVVSAAAVAYGGAKTVSAKLPSRPPVVETPKSPTHSRYVDGVKVLEGQQPPRFSNQLPDPAASGPHSRLRWDPVNKRVYQGREFNDLGHPVRDFDFTGPTFADGRLRPGHYIPEVHRWRINDPRVGPKSGWTRVNPGEPL